MTKLHRRGDWIHWRTEAFSGSSGAFRADSVVSVDHSDGDTGVYIYTNSPNSVYLPDTMIEDVLVYLSIEKDQVDVISEQATYIAKLESELEQLRNQEEST